MKKRGLKRTKSEMVCQFSYTEPIAMSTPIPRRLSAVPSKKRLSQVSGVSQIANDSISDWSILTDQSNRSRLSSVSQNIRSTRHRMAKKVQLARRKFRAKLQNKISKTHIEELAVPNWPANQDFDAEKCQRIVSCREDLVFEEYDMVVWEASPEKKKRKKLLDFFKISKKLLSK